MRTLRDLINEQARYTGEGRAPSWIKYAPAPADLHEAFDNLLPGEPRVFRLAAKFTTAKRGARLVGLVVHAGLKPVGRHKLQQFIIDANSHLRPTFTFHASSPRARLSAAVPALIQQVLEDETLLVLGASLAERCWQCGRALTDPVSVGLGIGPECRGDRQPRSNGLISADFDGNRAMQLGLWSSK